MRSWPWSGDGEDLVQIQTGGNHARPPELTGARRKKGKRRDASGVVNAVKPTSAGSLVLDGVRGDSP